MIPILTKEEMMEADARTAKEMHVPSAVLMERAALAAAEEAWSYLMKKGIPGPVLAVCGPGNNGGDGFAAGRILMERKIPVDFVLAGAPEKCSPLEKEQILSVRALNPSVDIMSTVPDRDYAVVIDALFGVSLSREVTGIFREAVEGMNRLKDRGAFLISIDLPSGVEADTGRVLGAAVRADLTLACAFLKPGELLYPGAACAGEVRRLEIGITERSLTSEPKLFALEEEEIRLPERRAESNKSTYGKVLLAAGSAGMAGAAVLAARSALKTGCGMVKVFTHEVNRTVIQTAVPEALVTVWREEEGPESIREKLLSELGWCTAAAVGPGLGTDGAALLILQTLLSERKEIPLVIDADGLNLLSSNLALLSEHGRKLILTPHPGEMSRLTGKSIPEVRKDLIGSAGEFAKKYRLTCVLKDARTVTAMEDGRAVINLNGNDGMATAGSGDVLTGIIASLAAQGAEPEKAAYLGAALHGRAGDRAAEKLGKHGLLAGDLADYIG